MKTDVFANTDILRRVKRVIEHDLLMINKRLLDKTLIILRLVHPDSLFSRGI